MRRKMFRIVACGVLATSTIFAPVSLSIAQRPQDSRVSSRKRLPSRVKVILPGDRKDLRFEAGASGPNSAGLLTTGDETRGAWSLTELIEMPGTVTTWHRHPNTDQAYYVRDGVVTFKAEKKIYQLSAGGYIFIPRGMPHGHANVGAAPVKLLLINGPAGFERYFQARAHLLKAMSPKDPAFQMRMRELRKQFDTEELGIWDPKAHKELPLEQF